MGEPGPVRSCQWCFSAVVYNDTVDLDVVHYTARKAIYMLYQTGSGLTCLCTESRPCIRKVKWPGKESLGTKLVLTLMELELSNVCLGGSSLNHQAGLCL